MISPINYKIIPRFRENTEIERKEKCVIGYLRYEKGKEKLIFIPCSIENCAKKSDFLI